MSAAVEEPAAIHRRVAVVYNPIKVDEDVFRRLVSAKAAEHGFAEPTVLPDHTGRCR